MTDHRNNGWMAVLAAAALMTPVMVRAAEHKLTPPAEPPKQAAAPAIKEVRITGTVEVTRDKAGKVTEVDLKGEDGTVYKCSPLNAWPVLEQSADKTVTCMGVESTTKDGTHRLHIKNVQAQPPGA